MHANTSCRPKPTRQRNQTHRDSAQQIAAELYKLQGELRVRPPFRKGALASAAAKSLASLKSNGGLGLAVAEASAPAGVVPAEGTRKPDEAFEAQ